MDKADIRRDRLRELIKKETNGNQARFCEKHGLNVTHVRGLLNKNKPKSFGEKAAANLERDIGLSPGYLSTLPSNEPEDIVEKLESLLNQATFLTRAERKAFVNLLKAHKEADT